MQYRVRFVGDNDLPVDWAIAVGTGGDGPYLFVKESAVSADLFTRAWRAWQSYCSSSSSLPTASNA